MSQYSDYLRKDKPTVWNKQYQIAFEKVKQYLLNPPVLRPLQQRNTLVLYLCFKESTLGAMLTQVDDSGTEFRIYYLSKKLLPYEEKYKIIEKICLAMVWKQENFSTIFSLIECKSFQR